MGLISRQKWNYCRISISMDFWWVYSGSRNWKKKIYK